MADDEATPAEADDGSGDDETEALRSQVAELTDQLESAQAGGTVRRRLRQVLTAALVVLTCVALLASLLGVWVRSTVYDTDNWIELVGDLPQNPEVATALATKLSDELIAVLDVEQRIKDVLPEQAGILAGPITNGLDNIVEDAAETVITSDQFRDVWIAVNRFAHEELVRLLEGDAGRVQAVDGVVQLNLLPLISKVLGLVADVAPDLVGDGQPVPDITADTPTDQARSELSTYLGKDLPDDFGVIDVFQSDRLAAAQNAFTLFARLVTLAVIVTVVLAAITIFLARSRRLAVLELAIGAVVTLAAARAIVRNLVSQLLDQIGDPQTAGAIEATLESVAATIRGLLNWTIWIAVLVVLVAFLTGPSRPAVWIRRQVVGAFGAARSTSERLAGQAAETSWVAENLTGIRVGVLAVGVLAVLLLPVTWFWFLLIVALVGLVELGFAAVSPPEPSELA